jgi:vitamin B12 transporter
VPLIRSSTVGEGGEGKKVGIQIMKKSIRLRARAFVPALSVLSLAVAASVQAQGIEINPVVISASRMEQPLSEVLSSMSVITRQDIEKTQAASLADLIQGEAGVEFGRTGGPGSTTSFFLRGQNSTNLVILIDGVRSQVDPYGNLQITDIPLQQVERVEVLRGNASALYGNAAVGGVINILTRQGKGKPAAYGSATYGSRGTANLSLGYSGVMDDLKFDINAGQHQYSGTSSMDALINPRVNPDNDGYKNQYLSGKLEKKIDSSLTLGTRFTTSTAQVSTDSGEAADPANFVIGDVATDVQKFKKKTDSMGLYAKKRLNDDWLSTLDISQSTLKYEDFKNGTRYESGYGEVWQNGLIEGTQNAVRWFNTYQLTPAVKTVFGADFESEKLSAVGNDPYSLKRESRGYFGGLTANINRLSVQANLRKDTLDVFHNQYGLESNNKPSATSGLLGAGYQLNQNWRLTSTMSTGFRAPGTAEIASSATIKPESHTSKEAGVSYTSDRSLVRIVYFQTETKDAIAYGGAPDYALSNIGKVQNEGVEASARVVWGRHSLKASYVQQDPLNVSGDKPLARRAREYASFDFSRTIQMFDLGVKAYASGSRPDGATANTLGGYTLWTLYASKKIDKDWTARVKLENVFDREYQLAYGFNTPGRGIFATLHYQPK